MRVPVVELDACLYGELSANAIVLNRNQLSDYIWVSLPEIITSNTVMYQLEEISPNCNEVEFSSFVERDHGRPWLKVHTHGLNLAPGYHAYKLLFIETGSHVTYPVYIGYIIQDDNPDKPYIYMNRDEVAGQ